MMKRVISLLVVAAGATVLCGCRPAGTPGAGVLVVDVDVVAKATGRDVLVGQKVELATQSLNARLVKAAQEMEQQFKKQQAELGSAPTEEQKAKVRQMAERVRENIQSNKEVAEQARQRVRAEQIQQFRAEVKAIAGRLASQRGATLVMTTGQDVFWLAASADITAAVIAEVRATASAPAPSQPAKPAEATSTKTTPAAPSRETAATNSAAPAR